MNDSERIESLLVEILKELRHLKMSVGLKLDDVVTKLTPPDDDDVEEIDQTDDNADWWKEN